MIEKALPFMSVRYQSLKLLEYPEMPFFNHFSSFLDVLTSFPVSLSSLVEFDYFRSKRKNV